MAASNLLALPKELRLSILEHLFADNKAIAIGLASPNPWEGKPQRYHPSIGEACRKLRDESLPLFYNQKQVVLLLRYREGRAQVQHWIETILSNPSICQHIHYIAVQYFEQAHRSTSFLLDIRGLEIANNQTWHHPLSGRPLKLLREVEDIISNAKAEERTRDTALPRQTCDLMKKLIAAILFPLQSSRFIRCESMANLRLHGYTDFQLRFEVISTLYCYVDRMFTSKLRSRLMPEPSYQSVLDTSNNPAVGPSLVPPNQEDRQTTAKIFQLPAELRISIYEYALFEPLNLGVGGSFNTSRTAPKVYGSDAAKLALQPAITRTSRQLRNETLPIFYNLNRFVLAVHYRRARSEAERWLDIIAAYPDNCAKLSKVTIKHRFGILDFKGTIDFNFDEFRILGPNLWFNAIPPMIAREVVDIVKSARSADGTNRFVLDMLRRLVEVLGTDCDI